MSNKAQGVNTSRSKSDSKSESDILIDSNPKSEHQQTISDRYQDIIKQARISTFGLAEIAQKNGKDFFSKVMDSGEHLSNESNTNKKDNESESDPKTGINKVLDRISASGKQTNYFRLGLINELSDMRKEWIDDAQRRGEKIIKAEEAKEAPEMGDVSASKDDSKSKTESQNTLSVRASRSVKNANVLRKGMMAKLAELREDLAKDIEETGKIAELNWRKERHKRKMDRQRKRQKLLGRIGWAEKKDIEELNRKMTALTKLLAESKLESSDKTAESLDLDRRRIERRQKQIATDYERRLYDRRREDSKAA